MALTLQAVERDATVAFVPCFGGERAKRDADASYAALTVHLRRMSEREAEAYQEFRLVDGELALNQEDCFRVFAAHAAKIDNLVLARGDGGELVIGDGATFATHRDQLPAVLKHLVHEVAVEIVRISSLTEEEEKN